MKPTARLHELGQSLWLDNITRTMLDDGTLKRYIDEYSVTGLTSNPTIFDKAISGGHAYDEQITRIAPAAHEGEGVDFVGLGTNQRIFYDIALTDLRRAAELFAPIHQRTEGVDGWVSLEVSPLFANDAKNTIGLVAALHARAQCENLFIKIPGTEAGLKAIEESIFAGIAVNVTLLFDAKQYVAAAEAYMRGIERRVKAGLDPNVASVASVFISRWDVAANSMLPDEFVNRLGIAIGGRTYRAYHELLDSDRWQRLMNEGARPQRLLWASTGTKDPNASDTLYIEAFASPLTINTMPEPTLLAFADHGEIGDLFKPDGGDAAVVLAGADIAGIDVDDLALRLQDEGANSFTRSWEEMIESIQAKHEAKHE